MIEISFLRFPQNAYVKCLERKCQEIVKSKLDDGQSSFHPGCSNTVKIFTLKLVFEKPWENAKYVFICLVNLEKAYD